MSSRRPVTITRARLDAGDYGIVRDGSVVATVERKSLVGHHVSDRGRVPARLVEAFRAAHQVAARSVTSASVDPGPESYGQGPRRVT